MGRVVAWVVSLGVVAAVGVGCTSPSKRGTKGAAPERRTTIFFLVDGLSVKALQAGLNQNLTPNLRHHFLGKKSSFQVGRAVFPTLTYPNITSILTTLNIDEHPILGNKALIHGEVFNFETPRGQNWLDRDLGPLTVFDSLREQRRESVSFAYVLGTEASTHMSAGIREGLEYQRHDYEELDDRLIKALEDFLNDRPAKEWPAFIYIHLVGVDGFAHMYGPNSAKTKSYLKSLDARLQNVLAALERGEHQGRQEGRQVVSILTSDHGFVETPHFVDLEKWIERAECEVTVLNELRLLALHFKANETQGQREKLLLSLQKLPGVEMVVSNSGGKVAIGSAGPLSENYPFLSENLESYFKSESHPDALVIAKPGFTFQKGMMGSHGGPTAEELFVPVLMRNATLADPTQIVRTSDLLKFEKIVR